MILLTLSRGKGKETVRLQLPASPAEIGEAFASLDRISLDTTATAILDVSSNVPVLYEDGKTSFGSFLTALKNSFYIDGCYIDWHEKLYQYEHLFCWYW